MLTPGLPAVRLLTLSKRRWACVYASAHRDFGNMQESAYYRCSLCVCVCVSMHASDTERLHYQCVHSVKSVELESDM